NVYMQLMHAWRCSRDGGQCRLIRSYAADTITETVVAEFVREDEASLKECARTLRIKLLTCSTKAAREVRNPGMPKQPLRQTCCPEPSASVALLDVVPVVFAASEPSSVPLPPPSPPPPPASPPPPPPAPLAVIGSLGAVRA
ncbi:hypothetical protein Vafri_4268, partial [Volvox africanus]